jgi:Mn2+/Fe2+ NRAMP family transporter
MTNGASTSIVESSESARMVQASTATAVVTKPDFEIREQEAWWRKLGPGLITGAADDDPSGIATYSQGGAQFGSSIGWTLLLTLPLMIGIQLASARIGRITGKGLAENFARICRDDPPTLLVVR